MFLQRKKMNVLFILLPFIGLLDFSALAAQDKNTTEYITMENAVSRALSLNNQVRSSEFSLKQATWDKRRAWTMLFPVVTFKTNYTWIDDSSFALQDFFRQNIRNFFPNLPPGVEIPQSVYKESYFSSFEVTMPIFRGALLNGLSIAGSNQEMQTELNKYTRDNIIFSVIKGYLEHVKNQEIFRVQNEYLNLSKLNYNKAERLYNAGRASKTEALRWQIEHQKQKSVVANSESALTNSMSALNRLLNMEMDKELSVDQTLPEKLNSETTHVLAMDRAQIFGLIHLSDEELVQVNAALSAGQLNEEISRLQYRNSYASWMPDVSLTYTYSWRENNTIRLDDYSPQRLMVNFSLPLFNSFQDYTALKSSYYAYKKNQEDFFDQIKNTRYILTQTANNIINLKTQMELSALNLEFNEINYSTVERQKEKGLVSNIDFVDAKVNLQNARLEKISNQYDFISAVVELYYLLGKIDKIINK